MKIPTKRWINGAIIPPMKWISSMRQQLTTGWKAIPSLDLTFEAKVNGPQKRFLELYGSETSTPNYCLFPAGIVADICCFDKAKLTCMLQATNLLNVTYQSSMSRLKYFEHYASLPEERTGIYEMGRNICGKLIYSW